MMEGFRCIVVFAFDREHPNCIPQINDPELMSQTFAEAQLHNCSTRSCFSGCASKIVLLSWEFRQRPKIMAPQYQVRIRTSITTECCDLAIFTIFSVRSRLSRSPLGLESRIDCHLSAVSSQQFAVSSQAIIMDSSKHRHVCRYCLVLLGGHCTSSGSLVVVHYFFGYNTVGYSMYT